MQLQHLSRRVRHSNLPSAALATDQVEPAAAVHPAAHASIATVVLSVAGQLLRDRLLCVPWTHICGGRTSRQ